MQDEMMETRFTKHRTYKNITICYDNLYKCWMSLEYEHQDKTLEQLKNTLNTELFLRNKKRY